ncbi:hypothetical protein HU200_056509 [Digitaria exilis]|uniref:Nucleoside phosphorylase domain-containing protein n=1 Tax=Digitaria exilis TaxID=1010633 RepID=A0A835AH75_9POAL|nr:hypothetical protein HU200_056509 [Digitaria exilis]
MASGAGRRPATPLQVLLLTLLLFAASAAALPAMDRVRWQLDRVNRRGASLGLVMSYVDEATALQASGYFKPWSVLPFVDLYGKSSPSISQSERLPVTPSLSCLLAPFQHLTLIDVFSVSGIVHYGTAGSSNDSMSFGDVSVPKLVAYTGAWTWKVPIQLESPSFTHLKISLRTVQKTQPLSMISGIMIMQKFRSPKESSAELSFAQYNTPNGGENLLGSLKYRNEELYSVGKPMQEVFWLPVDSKWFKIAEQLKVKLERCNDTFCLPTTPQVVYGLKGSSADMFLDNAEYRKFLFKEFGVSTVDEESAAVVMTTTSPGVPVIVFRGVSDLAGGEPTWSSTSLMNLASINALKVAVEFIARVGKHDSTVSVQRSIN